VVAWGQAVTTDRTARGLPFGVVELPGGDTELLAAWLPHQAPLPAGWEEQPADWGRVAVVEAPALAAPAVLMEAVDRVEQAAALVLVGPLPRRELSGVLAKLERVGKTVPPRPRCPLVEGGLTVWRGDKERFLLRLPAPLPEDPRWDLGELAAFLLERRWRELGFSGRVRFVSAPCPQLLLEDQGAPARLRLRLARQKLGMLAEGVSEEAIAAFRVLKERELSKWAVDPKGLAAAALLRLGWGQALGPLFFPVTPGPKEAAAFLAQLTAGKVGSAEVWEREVRWGGPTQEVLSNGIVLRVETLPSDVGILAVAIAGVASGVAGQAAKAVALQAAGAGLPAEVVEFGGMAGVAVVTPSELLSDQMEAVAGVLAGLEPASGDELREQGYGALGLGRQLRGENLALALLLPPAETEALEAAHKFFGAIPVGHVRGGRVLAPGLAAKGGGEAAQVVVFAVLPGSLGGAVLGELLVRRLRLLGVEAELSYGVGQVVLSFAGSGAAKLEEQDTALQQAWENARLVSPEEVMGFFTRAKTQITGSAARVALRQAMGLFLPELATLGGEVLAEEEIGKLLGGLPHYRELPRLGRGETGKLGQGEPERRRER